MRTITTTGPRTSPRTTQRPRTTRNPDRTTSRATTTRTGTTPTRILKTPTRSDLAVRAGRDDRPGPPAPTPPPRDSHPAAYRIAGALQPPSGRVHVVAADAERHQARRARPLRRPRHRRDRGHPRQRRPV